MKNILIVFAVFFSFISNAQTKTTAQPKEGFEVFTQELIANVVFPEEYYLNGGMNLRIAVDSLSTVKLISISPRNVDFFSEVKPLVEGKEWVPATIDGVSKTSVITLPIKLNKQSVSDNKKAQPKIGIRELMNEMVKKIQIHEKNLSFKAKFIITKEGKVTNVVISPFDKKNNDVLKNFLENTEWYPAIHNGKIVQSTFTLPITFKINENLMIPRN